MSKDANLNSLLCFVSDEASIEVIQTFSSNSWGLTLDIKKGGIEECLSHLKNNPSPDILLVDISDSRLPMTDMSRLAEICEPGVEVIAVGNRNEVGIFRDLIHLGIKDYLVKPLTAGHLSKTFEHSVSQEKKAPQQAGFYKAGKLVTFIGSHGGVGTSTFVANSAWALAEKESKKVSILDLDTQLGIIPHFFNLEPSAGLQELFEMPDRIDETLINRTMTQVGKNLTILSSQIPLQEQSIINPKAVESILQALLLNVHFSFVDLPRNFSTPINQSIIQKSDVIVIITDYSLIGLKETSRLLDLCKDKISIQQIYIIANKVGQYKSGELTREMYEGALQHRISSEVIFDALNPLEALRDGVPVINKMHGPIYNGVASIIGQFLGREHNASQEKNILNFLKNLKF